MFTSAMILLMVARPPDYPIDPIDPVPFPSPISVDRVLVFHLDEAILTETALNGVQTLTGPTHDFRNFVKGAMALAMLIAFVVGMYQGSIMRMLFAIGSLGVLWELGVKTRVPVVIDFYTPAMRYDYMNDYGPTGTYEVPFLLAKILSFASGVNGYIAETMDHSASVLMNTRVLVKDYGASVAEAIKTAAALQVTDPQLKKAIAKFADHCVAPAIAKLDPSELNAVGGQFKLVTALLRNGGPLSDGNLVVVDDVFSNQNPPPVVSCQQFLNSIRTSMENGTLTASSNATTRKLNLLTAYLNTKLNTTQMTLASFVGLGPVLGFIANTATRTMAKSSPLQKPDLDVALPTGGVASNTGVVGNTASAMESMVGDLATLMLAVVSRVAYNVAERGIPMLTGIMWFIIILGFPIAVMATAFMGWRTMLTYTFSVMWVASWVPTTVIVKQLMNAYMDFAGSKAVALADSTYIMLQGFVSLDLLKSLYTSAGVAMIIAAMLIISIPILTGTLYFVALKGASDALVRSFSILAGSAAQQAVSHTVGTTVRTLARTGSGGGNA